MQRGTPISEKGKRDMPRRKYPPLEADADGVLWCSQCDLPPMGQRGISGPWCQCERRAPKPKRNRARREDWAQVTQPGGTV